jgi:ketohexokinase
MAQILAVGIATLDIINKVDGYPAENSEIRAIEQEVRRGGNATNTLAVLSRLGHQAAWAGVLAIEPDTGRVEQDLRSYAIDTSRATRIKGGKLPTSYITLNRRNGSRTIVHYRDLPEYTFADFSTIDLSPFDWVHFEGRNPDETTAMLEHVRTTRPDLPVSLEVEKLRDGIETLFALPSLLIFSRPYVEARGFETPQELLEWVAPRTRTADLVCTWGEGGAWSRDRHGAIHHAIAHPPTRLVETLGAGDTFNAALIDALLAGQTLDTACEAACRLAGRKCGMEGFHSLIDQNSGQG